MNRNSVMRLSCLWLAAQLAWGADLAAPASDHALAPPACQPPAGLFTNAISVTLVAPTPAATVRFTLNGAEPTTNSSAYSAPIPISASTRLRARAFQPGLPPSQIVNAHYTLLNQDVAPFDSNLPILVLNTYGGEIEKGTRVPASFTVLPLRNGRASLRGQPQFHGRIDVELRGTSSLRFPKRGLRLALVDDNTGLDQKAPLLDLPADADWVLYPPYADKTFMRNALILDLWEAMGHYSVRHRFVEVFCHQRGGVLSSGDYIGVYLLIEKIKRGRQRVDIARLTPNDLTEPTISGGYLLKKDRFDENDNPFTTSLGHTFGIEYPKGKSLAPAQRQWINRWLNEFESVLMSPGYADPVNGYAKYLDVPTAIDHFWIVEMPNTIDGYVWSMFMHKNRNGKLVFSPIWDRDLSFGNADYDSGDDPTSWFWQQIRENDLWYRRLFSDPDFNQKHIDRWAELRRDLFATSNLFARVDAYAALLSESQTRDFARWPRLGEYSWPNAYADWTNQTFTGTVSYMKNFMRTRLAWIDRQFIPAPVLSLPSGTVPASSPLTLTGASFPIVYTVDGSDPRLPGGNISPRAIPYTGSLVLTNSLNLFARARGGRDWSPPAWGKFTVSRP
jgi:hypothetical protein